MRLLPDLALQGKYVRWSKYFAGAAIAIALIILAGWLFNVPFIKRLPGSAAAMNPVTAGCLFLSGYSFFHIQSRPGRPFVLVLIGFIFIAGLIRVADKIGIIGWNIDTFFGGERMRTISGVAFMVIAAALWLLIKAKHYRLPLFQYAALAVGLNGWLSLLGYLYQVPSFSYSQVYGPMSLYTAISFVLLSIAILLSRPDEGIMKPLTRLSGGSVAMRLIMPAAVLVPTFLGWMRMMGSWVNLYEIEFGAALYTLGFIIIFLFIVWYTARVLNQRDLDQKKAEDALMKSEKELTSIFNGAPDAIVVINDKSKVIKWNPEAEKLFLWSRQEAIGKQLEDLVIPEEFHLAHKRGMANYLSIGKTTIMGKTIDICARRKNKTQLDISLRISPIILNEEYFFVGFIRDITEAKKLEEKVREFTKELSRQVEEKTRELTEIFERLTDGFIALDNDLRYTYLNAKAGKLINREPASMIGKYVWDEFPDAVGSATYHAFNQAMEEQRYVVNTDRYDPLNLWQENHIYPSSKGLAVFIRDITEKKRAELALLEKEARYRTFVEEAADAIMVYSPLEKRYVEVNKKTVELLGFSTEELLQTEAQNFIFQKDQQALHIEKIEKGESVNFEILIRRKNGELVIVETSAKKLPDGKYLAFVRDITERKKAEEESRRLNEELQILTNHLNKIREEERTHIAREIHDELGQQLTVMKMDASWIKKKLESTDPGVKEKMEELLKMIDETVRSIRRIASELRPSLIDDLGLIAAMEWHIEEFVKRSGIEKEFHAGKNIPELPDNVKINLFRIFQEAMTNVARHSQASKVIVIIERRDNKVILEVTDNGSGYESESRGRKTLGILGMKERARMIKGSYDIKGIPGKGTTVTVEIPVSNIIKLEDYA